MGGSGAGSALKMQTPRAVPAADPCMMDHPTRRGNYDSGQDYVLEYGDLRFTFNERDFSERVEQAALKLGFVGGRLDEHRARGPRQPDRQRRGPGPRLGPRRARQRLLARARRPGRALARALAAPARLPLRLARPAREGGRARRRLRRGDALVRLRPARARRRADRALARAQLGPGRRYTPAASAPRPRPLAACGRLRARLGDRLGARLPHQRVRAQRAAARQVERREAAAAR